MKIFKSYILILVLGMMALTSCEDYFGDINVDPDNPTAVTPNVLLPQIQTRLAYVMGGDASRYIGLYTQHIDGVGRQFAVLQNYGIQPSDVDQMWANLYTGVMMDGRQLQADATENGYNHYLGISKAIEAYSLMVITDLWGDVPYSESFQGTALIQPKFDDQQALYDAVFSLISEARTALNGDDGGFAPGADDLFYGGDVAQWMKFLNVLEARAYLHLAAVDDSNYQNALNSLGNGGFEARADDARLQFGTGATESAPWFQYIEQRDDIEVGDSYVAMMNNLNDPRVAVFGAEHEIPGHPYFVPDQAQRVLTYTEAKFIEAECEMQVGNAGAAMDAYLEGIASSFEEAGVSGYDDYIAQDAVVPAGGITMNEIMTQKYIAMYTDMESFNDWRRTGIPTLDPNTGSQVPRRLPYAETEIFSNENTPTAAEVTIFDRVWWDQN